MFSYIMIAGTKYRVNACLLVGRHVEVTHRQRWRFVLDAANLCGGWNPRACELYLRFLPGMVIMAVRVIT